MGWTSCRPKAIFTKRTWLCHQPLFCAGVLAGNRKALEAILEALHQRWRLILWCQHLWYEQENRVLSGHHPEKNLEFHHHLKIPWRIHGAGIYAIPLGVYWWDPCPCYCTIYIAYMDPMGMGSICLYKSSPVMVKRTLKALLLFFYRKTSWIDSWGLFPPSDLGMLPSGCSRRPLRQVVLQL